MRVVATEADLHRSLFSEPPRAEALIARVGSEVVGFALFFHTLSTFLGRPGLYLEDLFVKPEWRDRGYGRQILAELARIAVPTPVREDGMVGFGLERAGDRLVSEGWSRAPERVDRLAPDGRQARGAGNPGRRWVRGDHMVGSSSPDARPISPAPHP